MGESLRAPWSFSPLAVVAESLAFTAANIRSIATWALAPLGYGLAFHYLLPASADPSEAAPGFLPLLMLLGCVLLWIRVPLELRVYRKYLLDESPGRFYGLELIQGRTWTYLWAYIRVMCLFVAVLGPGVMIAVMLFAPLLKSGFAGSAPELVRTLAPAAGMIVLLGLLYAVLAPRVILAFPDVALGGKGLLFQSGPFMALARKARWRMVAVMAVVWAPEHALNALSYVGGDWDWWKSASEGWWFIPASYLLGFATLIVSSAAGAVIYRRLRQGLSGSETSGEDAA
ncbi:hypothetical protein [Fundidesulfovibrio terrae]|uniref:hypothetical protein n=1 Tax=Fundidesulfovibrio terrae TaxID=2922866 RepID=UPI001FAF1EED|nr:hypothetical protein [Fundidesulfovibrio terrae]